MSEQLDTLDEDKGMALYEQLVDCCESDTDRLPDLIFKLRDTDVSGQFLASSARYLCALDRSRFEPWIVSLIEAAIDKDRERRYIGSLLQAIWGEDYAERAESLSEQDNNFRRIYKRVCNNDII